MYLSILFIKRALAFRLNTFDLRDLLNLQLVLNVKERAFFLRFTLMRIAPSMILMELLELKCSQDILSIDTRGCHIIVWRVHGVVYQISLRIHVHNLFKLHPNLREVLDNLLKVFPFQNAHDAECLSLPVFIPLNFVEKSPISEVSASFKILEDGLFVVSELNHGPFLDKVHFLANIAFVRDVVSREVYHTLQDDS